MTKQPSLDQKRAAYAWTVVQGQNDEYVKLTKATPALIMNNGLMQTLAFYQDKGKDHHKALNEHIIDWLAGYFTHQDNATEPFDKMMTRLLNADSHSYRKATEETLAVLRWIRQFAAISQ